MRGRIEGWQKEPKKRLSVIEFPRIGTLKRGSDGETYWVQTPAGTFTDENPQEIAEMERDAEVYSVAQDQESVRQYEAGEQGALKRTRHERDRRQAGERPGRKTVLRC